MKKKYTRDEIRASVMNIAVEECQIDELEITPNARFIEDLGADSLDQIEMVMRLEEEFGLEITDEEAENIQTVTDAVDFVYARVGK